MSNNNHTSDIKKAAQQVDVQEIKDNLQNTQENVQDSQQDQQPEALTEDQKTPFIDENARTDK